MEIELEAFLEEYKNYTIELLECLEKEDYDSIECFMNKRQLILDKLSKQNYDIEKFLKMFGELGLADYEQKLQILLSMKRDKVKDSINTLSKSRNANSRYNRNITGAVVFSKKI